MDKRDPVLWGFKEPDLFTDPRERELYQRVRRNRERFLKDSIRIYLPDTPDAA